jgi:DUF1680 family protein
MLRDRRFDPLPLGAVTPRGWLRDQLRVQADGLTGHIEEFWPDLADNRWLGGQNDGWERGPYYVDGLLPLAHLLDDDDLKQRADRWVEGFLNQDEDGWIGPVSAAGDYDDYDPWPRFVVLKVLRQHHEATGDPRTIETMRRFCDCLADRLAEDPLSSWGRFRWMDLVVSLHWLYERTGDDTLLELAATATKQGYDWTDHFGDFDFHEPRPPAEPEMATHVVNNAMGVKAPGVWYRQSGDDADRGAALAALDALDRFHGQATGLYTGDEHFGGRDPSRGTELCAVVELMYSLERLVSVLGDAAFGDRLERVAYNALPATFDREMWGHQYDQQANQVVCDVSHKTWTNGPDANIFGLEPNYGCCTANCHQGWPKFAASLWMRDGDGLAAVAYAPSAATVEVDDTEVTVTAETEYPFGDEVAVTVEPERTVTFPLTLRVPGWCDDATIAVEGEKHAPEAGTFHTVEREWTGGEEVALHLPAAVERERRYRGSVAFHRGPLTLARPVEGERKPIGGPGVRDDHELYPTEAWNHGVEADAAPEVTVGSPGEVPFDPADPPVEGEVPGRLVPEWDLADNRAGPVPRSPTAGADRERLRLVPYGCTDLRVTEFPLVE